MTASAAPPGQPVEVFWRPGCPYCSSLRRGLARRGVTATWRNIWDDEEARSFVRSANAGSETVPTVRIGAVVLTNPSGARVAELAGAAGSGGATAAQRSPTVRAASWLPLVVLVVLSLVFDAQGHTGLSWAVDPFAVAAWWFTRPLRR